MIDNELKVILQQHLGALQLFESLKNHEWFSEEDAEFVGIVMGKYVVDLMGH